MQLEQQDREFLSAFRKEAEVGKGWGDRLKSVFSGSDSAGLEGLCLDGYTIGKPLGKGASGYVFCCQDDSGQRYALKLIPKGPPGADSDEPALFEREIKISKSLEHANIIRLFHHGESESARYIVLEYVAGETLSGEFGTAPLKIERCRQIFSQLAAGLDHAHDRGVVHRDLKPDNLICQPGQPLKILDFGLARAKQEGNLTMTGTFKGTPRYTAPEQVESSRRVGPEADQFSFGMLIFEALSGRIPYQEDPKQPLMTLVTRMSQPASLLGECCHGYSAETEAVLSRMLERSPEQRYPSVMAAYQAWAESLCSK